MKSLVVITARGGSKRIPKKNIRDFCGKPIIAYSIKAALKSNLFDEVMVSTDDEEISEISQKFGAKVPFLRSNKNSDDYAVTANVLEEVIEEYEKRGKIFDYMCCIYPTAPFITSEKLKAAFYELTKKNADSVYPVTSFSFPPQRSVVVNDRGNVEFMYPEYALTRSQDLPKIYHDAGQFYFFNVKAFKKYKVQIMPNSVPFILPEEEVQDIDNLSDWNIAEIKYRNFIEKNK